MIQLDDTKQYVVTRDGVAEYMMKSKQFGPMWLCVKETGDIEGPKNFHYLSATEVQQKVQAEMDKMEEESADG